MLMDHLCGDGGILQGYRVIGRSLAEPQSSRPEPTLLRPVAGTRVAPDPDWNRWVSENLGHWSSSMPIGLVTS
jgi:hypothetical protein